MGRGERYYKHKFNWELVKIFYMKILSFILNLPYTIMGLIMSLISIPKSMRFNKKLCAIIIKTGKFWWAWGYLKGSRATVFGNVVLLSKRVEDRDLEHELIHVEQYDQEPLIHPMLYFIERIKNGYRNNTYEVEAYKKAGNSYYEN